MASKKRTIVEVAVGSLAQAQEVFKNRETSTPAELLAAKHAIEKTIDNMKVRVEVLEEQLNSLNLPDLEAIYGVNPMIVLVDKNKKGDIIKTNVIFKEKMVTSSEVQKKEILKLGNLVPSKYIVSKQDLDKTGILNDYFAGTLDPTLMPYVSARSDLKFCIEERSGGVTPATPAGATTTPADDEAI